MTVYLKRRSCVKRFFYILKIKAYRNSAAGRTEFEDAGFAVNELLLFHRDRRDLNSGIINEGSSLNRGAGWLGVWHNALINFIHVGKLMNVGEVNGNADHILQLESRGLKNFLNVFKSCGGLGSDSARDQLVGLIGALLAGNVERVAGYASIAKRKSPGRREIYGFSFLGMALL